MPSFASFSEPGFWLIIAFVAAIVLLVARHYVRAPWRAWLAPAYWLFIPYFALLVGAVSPRLMGLFWIDWRTTFQVGAGLLLVIGLLAVLAWLFVLPRAETGRGAGGSQRALWIGLAGAEEWFWCFLRAALWEIALTAPQTQAAPLYLAVWGAALLALPLVLSLQESGRLRLVKTAILVVTTVVFLFTRNFWLCWLIHASLAVLFTPAAVRAQPSTASSPT
ncbi:MAG: hypothetical protein U0X20_14850 [Caldilineaceae bacterium]